MSDLRLEAQSDEVARYQEKKDQGSSDIIKNLEPQIMVNHFIKPQSLSLYIDFLRKRKVNRISFNGFLKIFYDVTDGSKKFARRQKKETTRRSPEKVCHDLYDRGRKNMRLRNESHAMALKRYLETKDEACTFKPKMVSWKHTRPTKPVSKKKNSVGPSPRELSLYDRNVEALRRKDKLCMKNRKTLLPKVAPSNPRYHPGGKRSVGTKVSGINLKEKILDLKLYTCMVK